MRRPQTGRLATLPIPARNAGRLVLASPRLPPGGPDGRGCRPAGGAAQIRDRGAGRAPGPARAENIGPAEAALAARGRRLVVLGDCDVTGDLAGEMAGMRTWFCARVYGRRLARNRALTAPGCARQDRGPGGREAAGLRWCRVSGLRKIGGPFVVAPPAGARVRTRLRASGTDAAVLRAVGGGAGPYQRGRLPARLP
jgi:hypothetical protein